MKRLLTALLASSLASPACAAPRVGSHDGFTRLVWDLPNMGSVKVTPSANGATLTLSVPLGSEHAKLDGDVRSYAVSGTTVTLTLAPGRSVNAFVLAPGGKLPARLVVDTGKAASVPVQASAKLSAPAPASVAPASAKLPGKPTLRVVIDPGHGGVDSGMVGYVTEKEVTLAVGLKVRDLLRARGIDVIMTRDRDTQISTNKSADLSARARLARADTVNAYVSIHVNAAVASGAQGIETWVFGRPIESSTLALAVRENGGGNLGQRLTKESSGVAQNLLGDLLAQGNLTYSKTLANLVQGKLVKATGAVNRGIGTAPFAVIRLPTTPAILIEVGFGSNPVEGRKLASDAYRGKLASAIADAIAAFLHVD